MARAPKGGIVIMGVFYRGGQFLPTETPQYGKFNSTRKQGSNKPRKAEVAPYKWEIEPEGHRSIFTLIGGTVAKYNWDSKKLEYAATPQILSYRGMAEQEVKHMIELYNTGEYWIKR